MGLIPRRWTATGHAERIELDRLSVGLTATCTALSQVGRAVRGEEINEEVPSVVRDVIRLRLERDRLREQVRELLDTMMDHAENAIENGTRAEKAEARCADLLARTEAFQAGGSPEPVDSGMTPAELEAAGPGTYRCTCGHGDNVHGPFCFAAGCTCTGFLREGAAFVGNTAYCHFRPDEHPPHKFVRNRNLYRCPGK